jgi:ATP-dependent exoDNAse (exonuclease V) beta subunit
MIINKFDYHHYEREHSDGSRKYITPTGRLYSVTTILEKTKPDEQKRALMEWKRRVGEQQAQQITTEAANRGTRMHRFLEQYLTEDTIRDPGSNPYSQQSHRMANLIAEKYLKPNCGEIYGNEVNLYYPDLYAGTTDCVAEWQGQLSIVDFKQTNKPKKESFIEDYFNQLAAYILAHDYLFETNIKTGVILMCSQNYELQHWVITGDKLEYYKTQWARRVEKFYQLNTSLR